MGLNMKKKSIIYVDGFNLFFGLLKGTKNKWLNLQKYFEKLRTDDDILRIKYFTTLVLGRKRERQQVYIDALLTLPKIEIIYGKFKEKDIKCSIDCGYSGNKEFKTLIEKRTDVNIASNLILDASLLNNVKNLVVVSGDSDLVPAIVTAKKISPTKSIFVYVPCDPEKLKNNEKVSSDIRKVADKHKNLPIDLISKSQFDHEIRIGDKLINKPQKWS